MSVSIFFDEFFKRYSALESGNKYISVRTKSIDEYNTGVKKHKINDSTRKLWSTQCDGVRTSLFENVFVNDSNNDKVDVELSDTQSEYVKKNIFK